MKQLKYLALHSILFSLCSALDQTSRLVLGYSLCSEGKPTPSHVNWENFLLFWLTRFIALRIDYSRESRVSKSSLRILLRWINLTSLTFHSLLGFPVQVPTWRKEKMDLYYLPGRFRLTIGMRLWLDRSFPLKVPRRAEPFKWWELPSVSTSTSSSPTWWPASTWSQNTWRYVNPSAFVSRSMLLLIEA